MPHEGASVWNQKLEWTSCNFQHCFHSCGPPGMKQPRAITSSSASSAAIPLRYGNFSTCFKPSASFTARALSLSRKSLLSSFIATSGHGSESCLKISRRQIDTINYTPAVCYCPIELPVHCLDLLREVHPSACMEYGEWRGQTNDDSHLHRHLGGLCGHAISNPSQQKAQPGASSSKAQGTIVSFSN